MLRPPRCGLKQRKVMVSAQASPQGDGRDWERSDVLSGPDQVSGSGGFFATRILDRQHEQLEISSQRPIRESSSLCCHY